MNRQDIEKLLGGYATGNLTPEEREALFAAAIEDQRLFDALAQEEPLRELLQDPVAKARLQAVLEPAPEPLYRRWLKGAAWAVPAAGLAAITIVLMMQHREAQRPVTIAQVLQPRRAEPAIPVPSPLPQVLEKRQLPKAVPPPAPAIPAPAAPKDELSAANFPDQLPAAPAAPLAAPVPAPQRTESVRLQATSALVAPEAIGLRTGDARSLFFGTVAPPIVQTNLVEPEKKRAARRTMAPAFAIAPAAPGTQFLGLRYSILRQVANGPATVVSPGQPAAAGAQIQLRFEPNDAGYLSIFEKTSDGWRLFASSRLERMMPYLVPRTGSLAFDDPGPKQLFIVFSRQPLQTPYPVPEERLDQLLSGNTAEGASYAVSTAAATASQTVAFPITLSHN